MRLVITSRFLTPTGGVELQMLQMSKELARRGHHIDLLFNRDGELRSEFETFCDSTTRVPTFQASRGRMGLNLLRLIPGLRAIRRARPDVIWVNNSDELFFGLLGGRLTGAPVICQVHGTTATREQLQHGKAMRICRRADHIVAISDFVRNQFLDATFDPAKITTVHNGIELRDYPPATESQRLAARRELGLPEEGFVTLFFGRLEREKGVDVLFEAWRRLALPPEEARLLVVGSTLWGDTEARMRELHALEPQGCHWLESRRDVITPLHAADVVVVPSIWREAFGRVVVEGLAAGLPVVASRGGGILEIMDGDLDWLMFEMGSEVELADRLGSLRNWRSDRPDLGQECAARAEGFSIERMVDGVEPILSEALASRS